MAEVAGDEVAAVAEEGDMVMVDVIVAKAEEAEAMKPAIILLKNGINCPRSSA